ncbi:MAG: hypothetical protein J5I90_07635 [Caldilineales bacterium]|nr:hypothetical protein [Caldilineales bacterium]
MNEERILTLHPAGKQGVNISRDKYDAMRSAILACLADGAELSFSELNSAVEQRLEGKFEGSIGWYFTTVKLDLEARGEIERVLGSKPQRLRLVSTRL